MKLIGFLFHVFKRGAFATTIGVTKAHRNDCTKNSSKCILIHPNFGRFIQYLWFLENFQSQNYERLIKKSFFYFETHNSPCIARLNITKWIYQYMRSVQAH